MEPYKDSCDHCGTKVDKRWWTFDLQQCVVCDSPECKEKQRAILTDAMDTLVNNLFNQMVKAHEDRPKDTEISE